MRFRTKLFLLWGAAFLLPIVGILCAMQWTLRSSFDRVASAGFAGSGQSLASLRSERVGRMRQAGALVMSIPELRALIAESNFELSAENRASLQERLDTLREPLEVSFICVIDARGALIAQNSTSPWKDLNLLGDFFRTSDQAQAMVDRLYTPADPASPSAPQSASSQEGLWVYGGTLYQVVGLPLVFGAASESAQRSTDGALVMAVPITDDLATNLGRSHDCQISFLAGGQALASSLPAAERGELSTACATHQMEWPLSTPFTIRLGAGGDSGASRTYRSSLEPLVDACSGRTIGAMLVQSSTAAADAAQQKLIESLALITALGLVVGLAMSYLLSGAVTQPVRDLVAGAQRVAAGDLEASLAVKRRDELGQLAIAFNDMVRGLRRQRELKAQVEASHAASQAKSQFLANMSHEIRTPLHGVIGMSDLLLSTTMTDRQRRYVSLVKSSAEVLTTLINDILDFSKIEAGKLELESVEFEPAALVEDLVELLTQRAISKDLEIACLVDHDIPCRLSGDPTRLRQILLNLISNAIKFTAAGSVSIHASWRRSTAGDPPLLHVAVVDTGIGIPPDRLDRLFKSFSQIDASTTRRYGGTGLGLAICKQLVELMGGQIGVDTTPGGGSTFWFTCRLQDAAIPQAGQAPARSSLQGTRLLLVDRPGIARDFLCRQLADAGIAVDTSSPDDAPSRFSADVEYAAILLDARLTLPGEPAGNREFLNLLRDQAHNQGIACLLLLQPGAQELPLEELARLGFSGVIAKPVRRKQLLEVLETALSGACLDFSASTAALVPATAPVRPMSIQGEKPFRILLAEDQEVNQIVASELLSAAGFPHDIVPDGRAVVEAVRQNTYDLILMDCQMPVMDGFEATRRIRMFERGATPPRHLPILALTANASGADRDRCLAAGMDGYCGKPFTSRQLLAAIAELLPETRTPLPEQQSAPPVTRQTSPLDSSSPFDFAAVLQRCGGKAPLAAQVLEKFEKQALDAVAQIEQGLGAGDAQRIARVAHAIKGTAGLVSAEPLRTTAARLEHIGQTQQLDAAVQGLRELTQEVQRCVAHARQMRSGIPGIVTPTPAEAAASAAHPAK